MDGESDDAVVLDCGSGNVKAGFAGEDAPRSVFPHVVGTRFETGARGRRHAADARETFVGDEAQAQREVLALESPVVRGRVKNWEAMEKVWEWALFSELEVDQEAVMPVRAARARARAPPRLTWAALRR